VVEPILLRQVQNYVTHGMAGFLISARRADFIFCLLTIVGVIAKLGEGFKEDTCLLLTV